MTRERGLEFTIPTKVTFGSGSLITLAEEVARSGFKRVALITANDLIQLNLAEKAIKMAEQGGARTLVYSGVESNPTTQLVAKGVEALEPFVPDCLVGFGGGSAIDLAKGIGICLGHHTRDIRVFQYKPNIERRSVPVICIPTTSGTGSEVNYWAVVSDPRAKERDSPSEIRGWPHIWRS